MHAPSESAENIIRREAPKTSLFDMEIFGCPDFCVRPLGCHAGRARTADLLLGAQLSRAGNGKTQGDRAPRQPQSEAPVAHPAEQAEGGNPALARVWPRGRGLRYRPDDLLLQSRASARLRGH